MEYHEQVQLDALLGSVQEQTERDLALGRLVHDRARQVLERMPGVTDMQIIHGSDDDRIVTIKRKEVVYTNAEGSHTLALTNFHRNHLDRSIAVEVADENGRYHPFDPDYLFAVQSSGEVNSPLGLVRPELAGAILELFEEVPAVDRVQVL